MNIRLINILDLPVCRKLRNENRQWFYDSGFISEERHNAWYNFIKDKDEFFVIEEDEKVIGTISKKRGIKMDEIGNLTLDEAYRGRGIMTEAVKQLIIPDWVYCATTLPHNIKSQKVFERVGFSKIGVTEDGWINWRYYA